MANELVENQPQLADTSDFLGTGPDLGLDVDDNPEPTTEEPIEEAAAEEAETSDEVAEPEQEEAYELPTEQAKVFPPEEIYKFGQHRYGYTQKEIEADPRLQRSLKDQLNSAILIEQQRAAQQTQESEEPTLEDESAEEPAEQQPATPQDRAQWLEQVVNTSLDPKAVSQIGHDFLVACGVDPEAADSKAILENSGKVGSVLAKGALDMFSTMGPQMQATFIESAFPGFTAMYEQSLYAATWQKVSASVGGDLPKYGTPEFQQAIRTAAQEIPGFEQMRWTDAKGRMLPAHQLAEKQYALLAKHMGGAKITPADVAKGVETGKRLAEKANAKRVAGKALGAGQSTQQFGTKSRDAVMDDLDAAIAAANRDMDPFKPR